MVKFINEKPARLIITIARNEGKTATEIAKSMGYLYDEIGRYLKAFRDMGLIISKQHGRAKRIYTTELGLAIAGAMMDIVKTEEKLKQV